jgi:transposase
MKWRSRPSSAGKRSGRDFAWLYPQQDQVCFLDRHVRAFEHFGAVPHRAAYDNLKPAVARVLVGSERELAVRFKALTTHYLLEASFARPRTGHDKGGVEARGKTIRWQELVPIPSGPALRTISAALLARLDAHATEKRDAHPPLQPRPNHLAKPPAIGGHIRKLPP